MRTFGLGISVLRVWLDLFFANSNSNSESDSSNNFGFYISEWALRYQYWGVYDPNSIVDSVRVVDWTAEWGIIGSIDNILLANLFRQDIKICLIIEMNKD